MKISPNVTVGRLAQLKPGDLFLCAESGPFVGMVVHDPTLDGDRIILSLGPTFPQGAKCPRLVPAPNATVISCPPEDCGGPADFLARREAWQSMDAIDDLGVMAEVIDQAVIQGRREILKTLIRAGG